MSMKRMIIAAVATITVASSAVAQPAPGTGPVAAACQDDIAKYCSDKSHGNREVRTCLEANKEKVTAACKTALETTGGGRGMGRNRAN